MADRFGRVGLVAEHRVGAGARSAATSAPDRDLGQGELEGDRIMALPDGGDETQWPTATVRSQVHLGRDPSAGAAKRLSISLFGLLRLRIRVAVGRIRVIRRCPLCRAW